MSEHRVLKGEMTAKGRKFSVVVSRFNEFISNELLKGAIDTLTRHGASEKDIDVIWTPGAFEVPVIAKRIAVKKAHDAVICLGAVIRGDTPHFDFVAAEASKGIAKVSMDEDIPCVFGIITTDTVEQAIERAGTKSGNKGRDAALCAIELADLYSKL
jgi:6,7-dimethyl-8-ribityllumazine synthase